MDDSDLSLSEIDVDSIADDFYLAAIRANISPPFADHRRRRFHIIDFASVFSRDRVGVGGIRHENIEIPAEQLAETFPDVCPICLDSFSRNQSVTLHPCGHSMCNTCIQPWIGRFDPAAAAAASSPLASTGHKTCPLCRSSVLRIDHYILQRDECPSNSAHKNSFLLGC
jgi:hypothetical protein